MFTSPVMSISGTIYVASAIMLLIFCVLDGHPQTNKYGESPKYKKIS
jgi:uncharacterized membrane protein YhaH (DUF805 family)